jgi:uncharacterized protein YjbI with pentapeptide repeats
MPRDLTPEERKALTDPEAFAKATARGPFRLEGRIVSDLEIPALVFDTAELKAVELRNVELRGTRFKGSLLDGVGFQGCRLDKVVFEGTDLWRTSFEYTRADGVGLTGCRIKALRSRESSFTAVRWDSSKATGWEDFRGVHRGCSFRDVEVAEPRWQETRFPDSRLEHVVWEGGKLEDVSFTGSITRDLALRRVAVDGLDLGFGEVRGMAFDEVRGRSIGFNQGPVEGARFTRCEIAGVAFGGARVSGLVIERCPMIAMLAMEDSEVSGLNVSDSTLRMASFSKCRVAGANVFDRVTFEALGLGSSTMTGLVIRRSTLDGPLEAEKARIVGMRLEDVRYGKFYQLLDAGAVYEGGDRFPKKRP